MEMPVGSTVRCPGASTTGSTVTMSAPASPASAYAGSSASGRNRCTRTSKLGGSWGSRSLEVTGANATLADVSTGNEPPADARRVQYREQLRTPWWWYLVAVGVAGILAAEFHVSKYDLTDWIPWCTLVPLSIAIVWFLGRSYLEIRGGEVRIRGAHLPLSCTTGVVALDAVTLRRVVGREGDPAAFVSIRPWIGPGVQLWLDDPEDPTPYWVVSSRHPERVVELVRGAL